MYYKVEPGSKAHLRILKLKMEMDAARKAAAKIVDEVGGTRWTSREVAGGITGIEISEQPKGFKKVGRSEYPNIYMPKAIPANKDLIERIQNLPIIQSGDVANALNFEPQEIGRTFYMHPVVLFKSPYIVEVNRACKYKPLPGMVEITETEYYKIKNKKK